MCLQFVEYILSHFIVKRKGYDIACKNLSQNIANADSSLAVFSPPEEDTAPSLYSLL